MAAAALMAAATAPLVSHATPGEVTVAIRMFQFQPDTLQVRTGTRVIWHNQDEIQHTVTAGAPERPEAWASGRLAGRDSTVAITFRRPGTYVYHCGQHPSMHGVVRVTHGE